LYAVTDRAWLPSAPPGLESLERQVEEAILGGATMIQLREKCLDEDSFIELALRVKAVTTARGVPLIVNDNLAVALAAGTDGLHIGQSDCDPSLARKSLPAGRLLGISVQTVRQAIAAEQAGADYLGVGAVFPTGTKTDAETVSLAVLKEICGTVAIPVVAIGGIDGENIIELSGSGIAGIAVVSALFSRPGETRARAVRLRGAAERMIADGAKCATSVTSATSVTATSHAFVPKGENP